MIICDGRAKDFVGGSVVPVNIQGFCSYSVYSGPNLAFVVQFRLELKTETILLARKLYGSLAPAVSIAGLLGEDISGK